MRPRLKIKWKLQNYGLIIGALSATWLKQLKLDINGCSINYRAYDNSPLITWRINFVGIKIKNIRITGIWFWIDSPILKAKWKFYEETIDFRAIPDRNWRGGERASEINWEWNDDDPRKKPRAKSERGVLERGRELRVARINSLFGAPWRSRHVWS